MKLEIKNKLTILLIIITAVSLFFAGYAFINTDKYKKAKDKETTRVFDLEEKLNKAERQSQVLDMAQKKSGQQLEQEKQNAQAARAALSQQEMLNKSLEEELHKVVKVKEALEKDLRDALAREQSVKK